MMVFIIMFVNAQISNKIIKSSNIIKATCKIINTETCNCNSPNIAIELKENDKILAVKTEDVKPNRRLNKLSNLTINYFNYN